ncbi:PRC-barrel domain-containing protein [Actinoplanes couchii]|uniref:PRC-barrel domain-containing protein n=1 Tax=Actinoplanes couchii TaxID=403638 RepID=A0ABQ3XR82_9ACTN|nr:PRC-barrel domain-containing protein [Actinoplanes couchii]MDR6318228.1 sporulation protein YlmC with PRC-barrel domain [Actinoplanes couchii]GID61022.1 hypothetical protein Aco03nite_094260 [Actinoplanes couchii]
MDVASGTLMRLGDSGQMLADPGQDIRGRKVLDRDRNEIGRIAELLVDAQERQVRLLQVEHGGLFGVGATPLFIPAEAVEEVTETDVSLDRTRVQVADAPAYDPELLDRDEQMARLYGHYGYAPYWAPGFIPPRSGFFR